MIWWLWRRIEDRVETLVTNGIAAFYQALVGRGQIPAPRGFPPTISLPAARCSRRGHTLGDKPPRGRALPRDGFARRS